MSEQELDNEIETLRAEIDSLRAQQQALGVRESELHGRVLALQNERAALLLPNP